MERRKFVVGLGALATGSAAAVGSGAYSSARMERDAQINVVNDADGLVGLEVGDAGSDSGAVRTNDNELTIGLGDDTNGVNVNSVYQVGSMDDMANVDRPAAFPADFEALPTGEGGYPSNYPAFVVTNNGDDPVDVSLQFNFADSDNVNSNGSRIIFAARNGGDDPDGGNLDQDEFDADTAAAENGDASLDFTAEEGRQLGVGKSISVAFAVDTTREDASSSEDLSGSLVIRAGAHAEEDIVTGD